MTLSTQEEVRPQPENAHAEAMTQPVAQAVAAALLLWFSYPPAGWSWLAWFALVPLFLLVRNPRSVRSLVLATGIGGVVFWLLAIQWIRLADPTAWLGWLILVAILSLWWPGFLLLARAATLRLGLPLILAAPILWVGLEYPREYLLTGFPWYYLGHSQYRIVSLIQIADLSGSLGVSFLIALVNAWCVDLLTLPLLRRTPRGPRLRRGQVVRAAVVVTLLVGECGYGAFRLATARFREGPRLALLQSDLIQVYKLRGDQAEQRALYLKLVELALHQDKKRPDLIVWPETSYPYGRVVLGPQLDVATLAAEVHELAPTWKVDDLLDLERSVSADLHGLTDAIEVPMLVGISTYDFRRAGLFRYNSAVLVEPGVATVQSYAKRHLVPFGEYVPLRRTVPWLVGLTPYRDHHIPDLKPGASSAPLRLGPYRLALAICFEDTLPHLVGRSFEALSDGRQPDLLLNLSNDGWFHHSSEHEMHLASSVFRAVENRVPLARAANTGMSAIVDGNGRVLHSLETGAEGAVCGAIPLDDRESLYSRWGNWLGLTCTAISIGLIPLAAWRAPRVPRLA